MDGTGQRRTGPGIALFLPQHSSRRNSKSDGPHIARYKSASSYRCVALSCVLNSFLQVSMVEMSFIVMGCGASACPGLAVDKANAHILRGNQLKTSSQLSPIFWHKAYIKRGSKAFLSNPQHHSAMQVFVLWPHVPGIICTVLAVIMHGSVLRIHNPTFQRDNLQTNQPEALCSSHVHYYSKTFISSPIGFFSFFNAVLVY